jgi:hypothetical protein
MTTETETERFVRSRAVLTREVADAMLLLCPDGGEILSLSGSGPEIWRLLGSPHTLDTIVDRLADQFDVTPSDIAPQVRATVDGLVAARVVERRRT